MGKFESLETIKDLWSSQNMPLGEKASAISREFYGSGLDFATTAAYIKATPSELDALLEIGGFDDDVLAKISEVNPSKAAWTMLSNASESEVEYALSALEASDEEELEKAARSSVTEYVYFAMIEVAAPNPEQRAAGISSDALKHAVTKAGHFDDALNAWETKFMNSVAAQKKRGKVLSEKQGAQIAKICRKLAERGVISRDSIDGDQSLCDEILDAIGQ